MKHIVNARNGGLVEVDITRAKAIKIHCTECMGDDHPKDCTSVYCALFPYRGKSQAAYHADITNEQNTTP